MGRSTRPLMSSLLLPPIALCILFSGALIVPQWTRALQPAPAQARRDIRVAARALGDIEADEAFLDRRVERLTLRDATLEDAAATLARDAGINVTVERSLGRFYHGLTITLALRDVTVAAALRAICDRTGRGVDYAVDDGMVWIGSYMYTTRSRPAVFDLRPLLPAPARDPTSIAPVSGPGLFVSTPSSDAEQLDGVLRLALLPSHQELYRGGDDSPTLGALWRGRLIVDDRPTLRRRVGRAVEALRATDSQGRALAAHVAGPAATVAGTAPAATRPGGRETAGAEKLAELRPELALDDMHFDKAVETIARTWHVNIVVDWTQIGAIVDADAPVRVHLWDVRLSQALEIMLAQCAVPSSHPAYRMEDGVITISSADHLGVVGIMKVYDVRDLIDDAVTYGHSLPLSTQPSVAGTGLATTRTDARTAEEAEGVQLRQLLVEALGNDARGQIQYWSGRLIVTDLAGVHQRMERLLRELRMTTATTSARHSASAPSHPLQ